jgi:hypothetical protein
MPYDYAQQKTPIFAGINDLQISATPTGGNNAGDLIAKVNKTLDELNKDLPNLDSRITTLENNNNNAQVTALQNSVNQLQATVDTLSLIIFAPTVKTIVVVADNGDVEAFDTNGNSLWGTDINNRAERVYVDQQGGFVYVTTNDNSFDGKINKLNLSDGVSQQQSTGADFTAGNVTKKGDFVYSVLGDYVEKWDADTLTQQAQARTDGQNNVGIYVNDADEVFVFNSVGSNNEEQFKKVASDFSSLLFEIRVTPSGDNTATDFEVDKSGRFFVVVEGVIHRIDPSDGSIIWTFNTGDTESIAISPINELFASSTDSGFNDQIIRKIDPANGTQLESYTITSFGIGSSEFNEKTRNFVAGLEGGKTKLYFDGLENNTNYKLYKFDWESKSVDWFVDMVNIGDDLNGIALGES